jgi:transaldolase
MSAITAALHRAGTSLWLDNITRDMLDDGTLARYVDELSVTGLTSNPSIFNLAVKNSASYDTAIAEKVAARRSGEELFFELAIEDLTRAADLFAGIHARSGGVDGWVSLEVSPLLAYDTAATIDAACRLHAQAGRENVYIKIPGTPEGLPAIQEAIYRGVPVNVTLLFSREQYLAAADAYLRGIERRVEEGLSPRVCSVASLFISRWDTPIKGKVPAELENTLGIAVGKQCYRAYRDLISSDRMARLCNFGGSPQRLLWASTGTKDPAAADTLYVDSLVAPQTVNTMPEKTLLAFADHGTVAPPLSAGGGEGDLEVGRVERAGIDVAALAGTLQKDGAEAFVKSWKELLGVIDQKASSVAVGGGR